MTDEIDDLAVVAVGGNLKGAYGSCRALLEAALAAFPTVGLKVHACSRWWRSASWPDPKAPDYLNGAALVETGLSPAQTLAALQRLEEAFGRVRGEPNAPRTLDLDLIAHGRAVIEAPEMILPHPRAAERLFVMGPLAEIAPGWTHPVSGETAQALAAKAPVGRDARPL
jgi:2-amino-4-hydroxy-6-hydroxymethyldihydropteridine diphosphokinase